MSRFSLSTKKSKILFATALLAVSAGAMAADDTGGEVAGYVSNLFGELMTEIKLVISETWKVLLPVLAGGLTMALVKKFAKKAL